MQPLENWLNVCDLEDIPVRGARRFETSLGEIAVFRTKDQSVYAIDNRCPHKNGPLSEGIVHDTGVTCPLHGWIIDLQSGEARGADSGCVKTYPVKLAEGRVLVKTVL
ncbi:MAG: nitrite reductase small subunit NirD [Pseudomonadota bacterium]